MMKFATIMREAGICTRLFPDCGEINVVLYDEDDQIHKKDDVHFVQKLFADNPDAFNDFFDFVDALNTNPDYLSINIQITRNHVIVFYKTASPKIFCRTQSLDPSDYAD